MMTRKDYNAIAEILNDYYSNNPVEISEYKNLISDFSDFFLSDNPNFKPEIFKEKCFRQRSQQFEHLFEFADAFGRVAFITV